jgi:hypothetical protein
MVDTATPETGPVDAPASIDSLMAEFEAGGEAPADALEDVTQELVNEAEGKGDAEEAPATEDDATEANDEAEEAPEGTPEEPTFTVKVNGEEITVSQSELLKGYSRNEDYKAKTAAVAEERRQVEALRANADTEAKAQYANQLEEATNLFAQFDPVLAEARNINWEALKQADPAAYVQAQDAVQARLNAIQQMQQTVANHRGEAQQRQQQQMQQERTERFDTAANKIVEAMPELADEAKFATFASDAIGVLRGDYGFTSEEITDVLDHRVLQLADDARRWRAHQAAQKSLPEKKVIPKSAVKPLTTDGSGSRASNPRFPVKAAREKRADWIIDSILAEE